MNATQPINAVDRNDDGPYKGTTLTAGQLIAYLSQFPADMPVTAGAGCVGVSWLNIEGASNPYEYDEPSIVLELADDFDARQW